MDSSELKIRLVAKMRLSQKRYSNGELLFTLLEREGEVESYDIRYFYIDNDGIRKPSKSGFRIPAKNLELFTSTIKKNLCELIDTPLWETGNKIFHVRYSEAYGGGVDFRKYVDTKRYVGWEKGGLRISEKDWYNFVKKSLIFNTSTDISFYEELSSNQSDKSVKADDTMIPKELLNIMCD